MASTKVEERQPPELIEIDCPVSIKKILMFTDIHFGKKNNSIVHNQDCLDFVDYAISIVKKDPDINAIGFLGDWFENRNSINVMTMEFSNLAASRLDALGIPIFFIVGNHDLYHRHTRDIFSTKHFSDKKNFKIIDKFASVQGNMLFSPYLFHDEYIDLLAFNDGRFKYAFGHFEFRNFVLTGTSVVMEKGPEHINYDKFKYIFSGHFHKRQYQDNTIYIGNTFPMDFGDAGDTTRGCCVLDVRTDELKFFDWDKCPLYFKVSLKDIIENDWKPPANARVLCKKDIDVSYSEVQDLKHLFISGYNLREFKIDESYQNNKEMITDGKIDEQLESFDVTNLNEAITEMIRTGIEKTTNIDPEKLCEEFNEL